MARHIVGTLQGVNIGKAFGNDLVDRHLQVDGNVRISVLVNRQRGGSVLNEDMEQANLGFPQVWQRVNDLRCDEVETTPPGSQPQVSLEPGHGGVRSEW